jgi:quercetin dioxygenase-like cupin family protein
MQNTIVGLLRTTILLVCLAVTGRSFADQQAGTRTPADQIPWPEDSSRAEGSAMRKGLQTLVIMGDAKAPGLYTMMFKLPPNTRIPPHSHPDPRSCFVLSGTWYFAYGDVRDDAQLLALPAGSHYAEPAGMNHFAQTGDEEVVAACTGVGPTGTTFVNAADDPRRR